MVMPREVVRELTKSSAMSGPESGNSRVPWPTTTGKVIRLSGSTRSSTHPGPSDAAQTGQRSFVQAISQNASSYRLEVLNAASIRDRMAGPA